MANRRGFLKSLLAGGAAVAAAPFVAKSASTEPITAVMPMYTAATPGAWVKVGNVLVWDPARRLDDPTFNG